MLSSFSIPRNQSFACVTCFYFHCECCSSFSQLILPLSLSFTLQKTFKVCTLNKDVQNLKLFRIWTKIFCEASYILFRHNHRLLDGASQVADDAADHVCAVALYRVGRHLGFLILLFALMLKVPRCKNIKPVAVFSYQ